MTRPRMMMLTMGAAASAMIVLIAFFKAPALPVAVGTAAAVALLLWRQAS